MSGFHLCILKVWGVGKFALDKKDETIKLFDRMIKKI